VRVLSWFLGVLLLVWPGYAQVPSVFIEDLTWPEVRDAVAGGKRTAIIYVGSTEQNGPHMVIGKHDFVARALAQRIAEELGDALVYPIISPQMRGRPCCLDCACPSTNGTVRDASEACERRRPK